VFRFEKGFEKTFMMWMTLADSKIVSDGLAIECSRLGELFLLSQVDNK
jgi:hypothetical protein